MDRYPITICMAGAVSAGAYSAGAMSVLLEAIRLWESSNLNDNLSDTLVPKHRIILKGMTGASAGSVQAALSSLDLFAASDSQNLGREAWTSITLEKLFDGSDIDDKTIIKSVLNTQALKKVTTDIVSEHSWGGTWPEFIHKNYELRLSVTNLRGVPYNLELPKNNKTAFGMSQHNEYLRYRFIDKTDPPQNPNEQYFLVEVGDRSKSDLTDLTTGALASSAFPLAFEPVKISRPTFGNLDIHESKDWLRPISANVSKGCTTVDYQTKKYSPSWNDSYGKKDTIYAVDGGVTNNEPLLEAFKLLSSDDNITGWGNLLEKDKITKDGKIEGGRVLFIDPFPNSLDKDIKEDTLRIDKQAGALKSALIGHARFSEPLLVSERLRNRVGLVYPSNPLRTPKGNENKAEDDKVLSLKSGALGGFAGFLKKDFLEHDYELGRLNMMRFLRYHFTVPIDHPLVKDDSNYISQWKVKDSNGDDAVPIIPIFNNEQGTYTIFDATGPEKIKLYQDGLSKYNKTFDVADRKKLKSGLKARLGLVGKSLIGKHKAGSEPRYKKGTISTKERWVNRSSFVKWFSGKVVDIGWNQAGTGFLTNTILETIENNLAKQGLLDYRINDENGKRIGIDTKIEIDH